MADERYKKLLEYINYFEDDTNVFCTWESSENSEDGTISLAFPVYDKKLNQFIDDICNSGLLKGDYLDFLKMHRFDPKNPVGNIVDVDFQYLRAIFTYYVRQERFCDGLREWAAKEKVFLRLLQRLRDF